MKILSLETVGSMREFSRHERTAGRRVGFVPTMGYLHEGHLSLAEIAQAAADTVVASIFVNPSQFNNPEDLRKYPRDIPRDLELLERAGVKAVFLPTPESVYGAGYQSWLEVAELQQPLEGLHRPGHFRGVATVVSILFNVVEPDVAVFGEKDFQQLRLIERMTEDLKFPIQILRGPTVREPDGLAMSSRNVRLSPEARKHALGISRGLFAAQQRFKAGVAECDRLVAVIRSELDPENIAVEYASIVDEETLAEVKTVGQNSRALVAAVVGGVRLIDNLRLE